MVSTLLHYLYRRQKNQDFTVSTMILRRPFYLAFAIAPLCRAFVTSSVRRPSSRPKFLQHFATTSSSSSSGTQEEVASMRAGAIKAELESYGINTKAFLEKSELVVALEKARADGLEPVSVPTKETTTTTTKSTSTASNSKETVKAVDKRPREERLREETAACEAMKASELKQELQERGVATTSFFEKSEFVKALAEARVDGVVASKQKQQDEEGYAEYANVEVLPDDSSGPRTNKQQSAQRQQQPSSNPFAGGMGGMGGMGNIADILGAMMGGGGAAAAGNPFGGGAAAAGNPFGGGASPFGGDMMGKAQQMMSNPKVQAILQKAQSNPSIMKKVNECMSNPASFAKYQNDPDVKELITEMKKYM